MPCNYLPLSSFEIFRNAHIVNDYTSDKLWQQFDKKDTPKIEHVFCTIKQTIHKPIRSHFVNYYFE